MDIQARQLLDWYDQQRRILPWREDPTPYHVWLSEIMLQQTRVEAVIDYYLRFLRELPDVAALAEAEEDQYMKLWEGLGYYSRVRNLHKAAVQIMSDYDGQLPGTAAELKKLSGIGDYTSAAIASIAFGEPTPAIDGNLLRVFSRMERYGENIKSRQAHDAALAYYQERIPADRPGDYNQALMDLGATVCLPNGAPLCDRCPWEQSCAAHLAGVAQDLPVVPAKTARKIEKRAILLITDGRRVLIRRRPATGLLASLYEYPGLEGRYKNAEIAEHVTAELGIVPKKVRKLKPVTHIFSHKEWHMTGYEIQVSDLSQLVGADPVGYIAASFRELRDIYAIPSAFAKFTELFPVADDDEPQRSDEAGPNAGPTAGPTFRPI